MKNRIIRMLSGGGGSALSGKSLTASPQPSVWIPLSGFTMAEILLSLTIIGVVAAITLPSLTGNINERTWNTQRKALFARFSQALALMPSLNGYGIVTVEQTDENGSVTQSAQDTTAESFLTEGLSKVLKINNICDSDHVADCGFPTKIIPMALGSSNGGNVAIENIKTVQEYNSILISRFGYKTLNTNVAAFETANGESLLVYYNPQCTSAENTVGAYPSPHFCVNFIYDLNGSKGPNTFGKDIGIMTAFYPSDSQLVAPLVFTKRGRGNLEEATKYCKGLGEDARLPNKEELLSLFINEKLLVGSSMLADVWSSSRETQNGVQKAWRQEFAHGGGIRVLDPITSTHNVLCVKR